MAFSVSSAFWEEMHKTNPTSIIRTVFMASGTSVNCNITEDVLNFPVISRNIKEVIGDGITITVNNADQRYNTFITSRSLFYTKVMTTAFGYAIPGGSDETITLFSGQLNKATFDGMKTKLMFDNRLTFLHKIKLGEDNSPVTFIDSNHNPADLVWTVLTNTLYGVNLDPTTSTANTDIDWTSWSTWQARLEDESVLVRAQFDGENVITILEKMRELTDSVVYVDKDNKLFFQRWVGQPSDSFTFVDSTISDFKNFTVDAQDLINRAVVQHGYDSVVDSWVGVSEGLAPAVSAISANSDSQDSYGVYERIYKDTTIWHATSQSAFDTARRIVFRRGNPNTKAKLTSPLIGVTINAGDTVFVKYAPLGFDTATFFVQGFDMDLNTGKMTFELDEGFGFGAGSAAAFVLDDQIYGLLDQNYNFIL